MAEKDIEKALMTQAAVQIIQSMPQEDRDALLASAVEQRISALNISYEVTRAIESLAVEFALDYLQRTDVRERVKAQAESVMDDVFDGIQKALGKSLEDVIKSKYSRVLSMSVYGDTT